MFKKNLLIVVSLLLLASTTEFLWMESLSGKEDLFEVESELGNQLEDKSGVSSLKFKLSDPGWADVAQAQLAIGLRIPLFTPSEHPTNFCKVVSGQKLYVLYCQLKQHC